MTGAAARIALIHALAESVAPARAAFAGQWPQAYVFDLLDTSLAVDRAHAGTPDQAMLARFETLAHYAAAASGQTGRTAGILFTCSAFGPAIDRVKTQLDIPVLRPNESAFRKALTSGHRIGLIVTFAPSAASLESELLGMAAEIGKSIHLTTAIADGALAALKAGDGDRHDQCVAATAATLAGCDTLVLGQFSLARAAAAITTTGYQGQVITTPGAAVEELRGLVTAGSPATGPRTG